TRASKSRVASAVTGSVGAIVKVLYFLPCRRSETNMALAFPGGASPLGPANSAPSRSLDVAQGTSVNNIMMAGRQPVQTVLSSHRNTLLRAGPIARFIT